MNAISQWSILKPSPYEQLHISLWFMQICSWTTFTFLCHTANFISKNWRWVNIKCTLLLLLSCFSHVRLCATPYTAAHQAPPSLGFSRQEHWSGLPFPSPMHESEKWKRSRLVGSNSMQSLSNYQGTFYRTRTNNCTICMEAQKKQE